MQICPNCERVYDESEGGCPYCGNYDSRETYHIVYDNDLKQALELTESEFEEFKKNHPEYQ